MKSVFTLLLTLTLISKSTSQEIYQMKQSFYVESKTGTTWTIEGFLPQTIADRQRVIDIRFSDRRIKEFERNGVKYFTLTADNDLEVKFDIEYDIELFRHDLQSIKRIAKNRRNIDAIDLNKYLSSEPFENVKNKRITELASQIKGETNLEIVQHIFDFVGEHMEYDSTITEDLGATYAAKRGRGDCTEYSDLMVVLCRKKGIPARVVMGTIATSRKNPNHNWVEVYLDQYGWVPIDPTLAEGGSLDIGHLPNVYIYLNRERTDRLLHSDSWHLKSEGGVSKVEPFYACTKVANSVMRKAYEYYSLQSDLRDIMLKKETFTTLLATISALLGIMKVP